MALPTISQIISDVKEVLPVFDDTLYDAQLAVLVNGAIHKLEAEGVSNSYDYQSPAYYDYVTCIRYQVASDMDLDIDLSRMKEQYITRVNTLRTTRQA